MLAALYYYNFIAFFSCFYLINSIMYSESLDQSYLNNYTNWTIV
jgi:hypothetical protein